MSTFTTRLLYLPALLWMFVACGSDDGPASPADVDATVMDSGAQGDASGGDTSRPDAGEVGDASKPDGEVAQCVDLGDVCTACELDKCADDYCSCYGNAECGLLVSCTLKCDPEEGVEAFAACYQACATDHPEGISPAATLSHCAGTVCAEQCPGYIPLTECQRCLYKDCQPQMNACVAIPDCTALLYCWAQCSAGDNTCLGTCNAAYPAGLSKGLEVASCSAAQCPSEC